MWVGGSLWYCLGVGISALQFTDLVQQVLEQTDADRPIVSKVEGSLNQAGDAAAIIEAPTDHWKPDRYDPYVCEYMGHNDCWRPKHVAEGPPYSHDEHWPARSKTCIVAAGNDPDGDDAPAVEAAFAECKSDGHVVFKNTTYYIRSTLNTTGLKDVDVEVKGALLWDTNFDYWLANSLPFGFQNQTSAWHIGGENMHFYGHGYGTLHGNGDSWYHYNNGRSNLHGRPQAITITDTVNSVIEGLRFINSQMWTMTVIRSERVLLQDIYVNNTAREGPRRGNVNTDGVDTVYANNITFLRWTIDNGDDSISPKQNSSNIYIANSTFHNGEGVAVGSIGQYPGQVEIVENITAENIICHGTRFAARIKTWTGLTKGSPPNGGGGGLGYAKNITFRNFELHGILQVPFMITQCIAYNGAPGGCESSQFGIDSVRFVNASGTVNGRNAATLQCSAEAPCTGVELASNDLRRSGHGAAVEGFLCSNVKANVGFDCTGTCDHGGCSE